MLHRCSRWPWGSRAHCQQATALMAVGVFLCLASSARATLPDGRAWEMVSPLNKNGGDVRGIDGDNGGGVAQASADGNRITYVSLASFAEAQGASIGSQYVSDRQLEAGAWRTQNISSPMASQTYVLGGAGTPYRAFSSEVSSGLLLNGIGGFKFGHPVETAPMAGAPVGYQNYYVTDIPRSGPLSLEALFTSPPSQPANVFSLEILGATPDLKHVVVESGAVLASGVFEEEHRANLFEWTGGRFQALNIRPDGTPEPSRSPSLGSVLGQDRAISDDGSRVVWAGTAPSPQVGSGLFVRENVGTPQAQTAEIDVSQSGAEAGGGGSFMTASSDLSKVFFADGRSLTSDATPGGGGSFGELYEFDVQSGKLTDLTGGAEGGGGVQGVLGASEDGSYLYFVADGVLAPGAWPGTCARGNSPPDATCNLYLWHNGMTRFIAALSAEDDSGNSFNALGQAFDWVPGIGLRTARVSPDGGHVVFMSQQPLTHYDSAVRSGTSCGQSANGHPLPAQCEEVFVYDAATESLSCASCNPSGARPIGPSGVPGGTEFENNNALYQSRVLSEDGSRVFFDSADALVPQDTNGQEDVYEYENGHVYLLSRGRGAGSTSFVDASANGNDVFFTTREQLAGQDTDQLMDLYDVRAPHVPGEDVGSSVPPPSVACADEDCRPASPAAPTFVVPASNTFAGLGNAMPTASTPAAKPKVKPTLKPKRHKPKRGRTKRRKKARSGATGSANTAAGSVKAGGRS